MRVYATCREKNYRCNLRTEAKIENTDPFPVEGDLHQGSVLSPFCFAVVMDTNTRTVRKGLPEELLYADDIAISTALREELQDRITGEDLEMAGRSGREGIEVEQ